jgi:iron complex outermembrane receptor protein
MIRSYPGFGSLVVLTLCTSGTPAIAQIASTTEQPSAQAATTSDQTPSQTASQSGSATDSQSAGNEPLKIEEVIVTARRRAESSENVPTTIDVVSAAALQERGVQTQTDLQTAVSGLTVRTDNNQNAQNFVIRGESLDVYSGAVPGVQPYVNEVPLSANNAISFYDIDNIQVLKGPQGTLFGRNSTGGAVLIQTKRPSAEFGGDAQVQYGNLDRLTTEAGVDLPIVPDTVLLRIAGSWDKGGAFVHNLYDRQTLGDEGEKSGRGTLLLKLSQQLTNTSVVESSDFSGTNAPLFPIYVVPCGGTGPGYPCRFTPTQPLFVQLINSPPGKYLPGYPNGYVFPGGMSALPAFLSAQGNYVADTCCNFTHQGRNDAVQNETVLELSPQMTLKNIFGFSRTHSANSYGNSSTPYPILIAGGTAPGGSELEDLKTRTISDELQLQGKLLDERLTYILGAFYVDEQDENNSPLTGIFIAPPATIGSFNLRYHSLNEDESFAGFAQGIYALTDKLNLTLGGRYTTDELKLHQTPDSSLQGPPVQTRESKPSWTVSLDYHLTSDTMIYITTRGSWRVGGYDPFIAPKGDTTTAAVGGSYFLPETVKDVEAGAKYNGSIGGIAFELNADAFNQWADNVQKAASVVVAGNITSATTNAPSAEITGIEGDMQIRPAPWLHIGGTFTAQDARYTQNQATVYGLHAVIGPYADAPRYSGSIYGDFIGRLGNDAGTLTYHTDVYGQSLQYFGSLGALTPGDVIPGYALINMRLSWTDPLRTHGLTVSAFVKNLANKLYYTGGQAGAQATSLSSLDYGLPRTYGAVIRYDF